MLLPSVEPQIAPAGVENTERDGADLRNTICVVAANVHFSPTFTAMRIYCIFANNNTVLMLKCVFD